MKAGLIYGKKDLRIEEMEVPKVTSGKVKIQIAHAGICGSDLHIYHEGVMLTDEAHPLTQKKPPIVLGHEFSGTVVEVGEGVQNVSLGDQVAVEPFVYCGICEFCKKGNYNYCEQFGCLGVNGDGGFAEFCVTDAHLLHKLPKNVTLREGAIIEPAAVAVHAVRQSGLKIGETAAIFGAGPIGLLTLLAAKAAGVSETFVIDISQERLNKAKELGATYTINGMNEDVIQKIISVTQKGVDVAFEAAGVEKTFSQAITSVKSGGTISVIAIYEHEISFNPNILFEKEAKLYFSRGYANEFPEVIQLIAKGLMDVKQVITKEIDLEHLVQDGLELLVKDKSQSKILVQLS
ncbi:2,3-butanediol dehydrogenase [Bacillus sp. B15-48]|uniref:2,3-butanediol dehydrogenase n=1 Tax=Bacillus sp. B15-48 TaxID=1548601 RepID=UPI00193EDD9F|nr:2,3-butanediol dehydrogenase [Bacillus sp. B15-48]MBM4761229.1 alcohol dehydrogenase catalytic domain-containing protein [Bacillus sp. B15-48]